MNRLFAIGDIHGCYKTLLELFSKISPGKIDRLVFLGDYIDRGPASRQTIDFLIHLKEKGYQVDYLLGNHEWFLLNSIIHPNQTIAWMLNGGQSTLTSFGIESAKDLPEHYASFFLDLKHFVTVENYLLVHAGFNDNKDDPFSDLESMLWTRNETYNSKTLANKTIIHGHTPTTVDALLKRIDQNAKVLNIDTGCVYNSYLGSGKLTAMELYSKEVISVDYRD